VVKTNKVNKAALTKFFVATAVMLVGGLAVVVIPAATTTTAYADARTCQEVPGVFRQCETVGKNPESCFVSEFGFSCAPDPSNKDTGRSTGELHKECAQERFRECTVEGGPPER
jgi:hypothetical protein